MKKLIAFVLVCVFASSLYAANKVASKTNAQTTKTAPKTKIEMTVIESSDYASGKESAQITQGLANFLEGQPVVTKVALEEAKENPEFAEVDYSFLPVYLVKKTKNLQKKLEQALQAGYVKENEKYFIFPKLTRTGVYTDKIANPGVLEVFVMSQCPYGVMAESMIIQAKKDGKIPADKEVKIRYIVSYNADTKQFQSLHGSAEWEEDVRQLLIAKYYPTKLWKYLELRNQDYRSSRWDKAMEEAGISVSKITKKFDKEGLELLRAEAVYGDEYGINASPTFLWEGKELLDFGSVAQKPGLEFLNPARSRPGAPAAPAGSC